MLPAPIKHTTLEHIEEALIRIRRLHHLVTICKPFWTNYYGNTVLMHLNYMEDHRQKTIGHGCKGIPPIIIYGYMHPL